MKGQANYDIIPQSNLIFSRQIIIIIIIISLNLVINIQLSKNIIRHHLIPVKILSAQETSPSCCFYLTVKSFCSLDSRLRRFLAPARPVTIT